MAKGEANTLKYSPGERVPESTPAEEGEYKVTLKAFKAGKKGWKSKPKKFPNRMLRYVLLGTEDEITGREKELVDFLTLHPAMLRNVMMLAQAAQYPEELELVTYKDKDVNGVGVHANAEAVDQLLQYILDNEVVLRCKVSIDEFNGNANNRVKRWLPPEEGDMAEESDETDEDDEPKAKKKKGSSKSDDDEEADEDADEADEDDEEADSDDDEASDDDEDAEADDDADADSGDADDDEVDDDDVKEHKKAIKPSSKVKQGPSGKKVAKPAPKKGKKK